MDDRDSAHFAQATRQMLETGNFFRVRYQDVTRYQKPPGINWLQALFVKAFSTPQSTDVWPYRLPSLIGGWVSVLLTYAIAKKMFGTAVALISAVGLGSTVLLNVESHLSTTDAALLASVLVMQGSLWMVYKKTREARWVHWVWPLLFFSAMGLGVLIKGITPLVGILSLLSLSLVDRTTEYFKALHWRIGVLFVVAFSAAWLLALSMAEKNNYLFEMIKNGLLPKLLGGDESHLAPFGTHLLILVITLWPISLFLWPACSNASKHLDESSTRFLLSWIIPVWGFFEIMPSKLPQYILPTFPAIAILIATAIYNNKNVTSRTVQWLSILWCFVSGVVACAFIAIPIVLHAPARTLAVGLWSFLVLEVANITAVMFFFRNKFVIAFIILVLGNMMGFAPSYQWLLSGLEPVWSSQKIVKSISSNIPDQVDASHPLLVIGYSEPSLVFLLGTHAVIFPSGNVNYSAYGYALVDSSYMNTFNSDTHSHGLSPKAIDTIHSFNYSKGHWITMTLLKLH